MDDKEKFVAFGVLGRQTYGPYSESDLEMRSDSDTIYADRLVYVPDGCDFEQFYDAYCIVELLDEYWEEEPSQEQYEAALSYLRECGCDV